MLQKLLLVAFLAAVVSCEVMLTYIHLFSQNLLKKILKDTVKCLKAIKKLLKFGFMTTFPMILFFGDVIFHRHCQNYRFAVVL